MAATRSLKDVAKDPLVEKQQALTQKEEKASATKTCALKVVVAVLVGLVGGFVTSQVLKIRL